MTLIFWRGKKIPKWTQIPCLTLLGASVLSNCRKGLRKEHLRSAGELPACSDARQSWRQRISGAAACVRVSWDDSDRRQLSWSTIPASSLLTRSEASFSLGLHGTTHIKARSTSENTQVPFFPRVHVQQRGADEALVCCAQVVQQQREGLDRRHPHRLLWTLQRLGEEQRAPSLAHAAGEEGQERHAVCLDLRCCEKTTERARRQRTSMDEVGATQRGKILTVAGVQSMGQGGEPGGESGGFVRRGRSVLAHPGQREQSAHPPLQPVLTLAADCKNETLVSALGKTSELFL